MRVQAEFNTLLKLSYSSGLSVKVLRPQNKLEESILNDPEFQKGLDYGVPRPGHPEGKVLLHIAEVLLNIDKMDLSDEDREKLRLIALVHDTFKYKVDRGRPKVGENHHSAIARRFAERYISDEDVLDIIELHDEAYLAWREGYATGNWDKTAERLDRLLSRLTGNKLQLYERFFWADSNTGDKAQDSFIWFQERIRAESTE